MKDSNWDYLMSVVYGAWISFVKAPIIIKFCVFIGAFMLGLWLDLYVFILGIIVLAGLDAHLAIKSCIALGGKYESEKIKNGLLVKFKLYLTLSIMSITIDLIFHKIYNYEKYFVTYLLFSFVALYECGSMVESMNVIYPNNKIVKKFSTILNIAQKKLDDKISI